ncbi:Polypeptide N-acetylgalactosaminyltransferase 18 [Bagarius yarrelli]|uniref:Polypeptide N-acetylgalactosaminyltransferase 18 n=1 Tax=Bagarius yarrelli TaxID=175774 RepID=A0A556V2M5_BAGYA|nr:Polypeptide N-acetylgalactosaminyltransferase 18 [Bagarius yarrelli]
MKTLASTCVILSGMTNIACLLYVGWIINFVHETDPERKLEEDKGETRRIIERLERLENRLLQVLQIDFVSQQQEEHFLSHHIPALFVQSDERLQKDRDNAADLSLSDSPLFSRWGRDLGPESRRVALRRFQYYGYNAYLSDRLSLDRDIPDLRPDGCRNISYHASLPQVSVVFIFVDEALSVILRSVHSSLRIPGGCLIKKDERIVEQTLVRAFTRRPVQSHRALSDVAFITVNTAMVHRGKRMGIKLKCNKSVQTPGAQRKNRQGTGLRMDNGKAGQSISI